jgi:hypothetical protein
MQVRTSPRASSGIRARETAAHYVGSLCRIIVRLLSATDCGIEIFIRHNERLGKLTRERSRLQLLNFS